MVTKKKAVKEVVKKLDKSKLIPVVAFTDNTKRGVFFGWVDTLDIREQETLYEARMLIRWTVC